MDSVVSTLLTFILLIAGALRVHDVTRKLSERRPLPPERKPLTYQPISRAGHSRLGVQFTKRTLR